MSTQLSRLYQLHNKFVTATINKVELAEMIALLFRDHADHMKLAERYSEVLVELTLLKLTQNNEDDNK